MAGKVIICDKNVGPSGGGAWPKICHRLSVKTVACLISKLLQA